MLCGISSSDARPPHRWDLRHGQRGSLDHIRLAHDGAIMSLDWKTSRMNSGPPTSTLLGLSDLTDRDDVTPALSDADGVGWIASGGLDRTVKVYYCHVDMGMVPSN